MIALSHPEYEFMALLFPSFTCSLHVSTECVST
uniref:Uncharacterized protein n=1 Tax=Rhizophora mucronata TaxID=61149 RepID=A0A2P2KZ63_RHIMU